MKLKHLKAIAILSATLVMPLLAPANSFAQSNPTDSASNERARRGEARRERRGYHGQCDRRGRGHMRRALENLDLSDNQRAQVEAIIESARERRRALREGGRNEQTRDSMRELREESRRLIEDVLTPEQRARFESEREAHRAERRRQRIERLTERYDLTQAQVTRVTQILESADEARRGAMRNEDPRAAMRAIRQRTRAAIREVVGQ